MMDLTSSPFAVWIVVIGVVLWIGFRLLKFGGYRGALFSAHIRATIGEATATRANMRSTVVKVHALAEAPDRAVGLEIVSSPFGGGLTTQVVPVTLSIAQATNLAGLLQTATSRAA